MYCKKCGKEMLDGTARCPSCGARQRVESVKQFLTRENIEILIAAAGVLPLLLGVLSIFFNGLVKIPLLGFIFGILFFVIKAVVVAAAAGACIGTGYLMYKDTRMQSVSGIVALAASLISLITVLLIMNGSGLSILFILISLVIGLDIISRVFIQKMGIDSPVMPSQDAAILIDFVKKLASPPNSGSQQQGGGQTYTPGSDQPQQQGYDQSYMKGGQGTYQPNEQQPYDQSYMEGGQNVQQQYDRSYMEGAPQSYFDGSGLDYLILILGTAFISGLTLSIAAPWMLCRILKWKKEHTVINGRRLTFTGTGGQMIGLWIKWVLLSLITFGIYSIFASVDYLKWETKHTFFADENPVQGAVNTSAVFDGNTWQFVGYSILCGIISMCTFSIGFPWGYAMLMNWEMSHIVISGVRMRFDGTGIQLFKEYIIIALLSLVTFGIYTPWGVVRLLKWQYSHTYMDQSV